MVAPRHKKKTARLGLAGAVWMTVGEDLLGGRDRMALLHAVADHGSITHAAKAVGLSYKGAWDALDAMNRLAGKALVERSTGGRGGGGSRLTTHGARLLDRYQQIDAAHQRFMTLLDERSIDLDHAFSLWSVLNMKTSARNQFIGTVTLVRAGAVNDEVELSLPGGQRIVAIVTRDSTQSLGLRTNMSAMALIKASSVLIATDLQDARLSAGNQLPGTVSAVTPGAVSAEVTIELDGGGSLHAVVTQASLTALGLAVGSRATGFFQASSVILAVTA